MVSHAVLVNVFPYFDLTNYHPLYLRWLTVSFVLLFSADLAGKKSFIDRCVLHSDCLGHKAIMIKECFLRLDDGVNNGQ